jgi:hypothetical protein
MEVLERGLRGSMDFKSYNCAGDWIIERDL